MKKYEGYIWLSSALSAASFAYFMAILSGNVDISQSLLLELATFSFAISLGLNCAIAFIAFNNKLTGKGSALDSEYVGVQRFHTWSLLSFIVAVLALVASFSFLAALAMFSATFYVAYQYSIEEAGIREKFGDSLRKL
ncbi:hypothetical protein [Vibrio vulnificus]|uniref:hypothetical protein n=1 Tax=Vibrio vulnificus TaxID=672 RepID=UPI0009276CDA|nr:hypothetical protein [Vibrio vulnificus]EHG1331706.1 hypothetical protein [Vibrio vulnificus]EHK9046006.1 hypothetical protein [Vibrio vulnificus]OJI30633.1 hypothetical protein VV99743_03342 [Vibrio vulnificus]HAS8250721.1 hypothetical protein [Vibrio vulnificus]